ncbi:hypothetical protein LTR65_003154 [Meristemomyces frigidus]
MVANSTGWQSAGELSELYISERTDIRTGQASLDTRFFVDDGLWRDAPMLTGQGSFEPLPDVKNILVTGGEGFIASWLVRHLVTKYPESYNVVSFDKLDYCSSLNNARMLESRPNFNFFHGDLTHPDDVLKCLRRYKIDTVFHLAAHTHVDLSFGNSYNFTKTNVYGEVEKDAADLTEHSSLWPTNPYAASKAAAEMMVTAYARSFKLPAIVIRLNNVYGPHQYPEKIIPKFINLLQRQRALWIHGDGQHTRRYLYAGDAADAFDTILHRGVIGQIYNVDSRDEISNLDLAKELLDVFGIADTEGWTQHTKDRPFNDRRYAVDGSKLRKLGWKQSVSFEDGLAATVDWYSRFGQWWGHIDAILSPFPVVERDQVVSTPPKVEIGATPSIAEDDAEVGAREERAHAMVNGHSERNGVAAKKRKAADMA